MTAPSNRFADTAFAVRQAPRPARTFLTGLLELVFPVTCAGCDAPGASWCARCASNVGPPRFAGGRRGIPGVPRCLCSGAYTGSLRSALLSYKEHGRGELAEPFADQLAATLLHTQLGRQLRRGSSGRTRREGPYWIVPVPSRPAAARGRGGDHVMALARRLADRLADYLADHPADQPADQPVDQGAAPAAGYRAVPGTEPGLVGISAALRMRRGVRDSVGLTAEERSANLRGRVAVRPEQLPPKGATVLLVDDVVTTGATLRNCVAALAEAGTKTHGALVLCDATGHAS